MIAQTKLEGKVAGILSIRELIINIGSTAGVTDGMVFKILADEPYEVKDPQTDEVLGIIEREKVRVKVVDVKEKLSICKTYRKYENNLTSSISFLGQSFFGRAGYETLKAEDSSFLPTLSEEESYVKRGDNAVLVVVDDD